MNNICVFCGSSEGKLPIFKGSAIRLGELIAREDLTLIYGGGRLGLMGNIADTVLEKGGRVIGVIPEFMIDKEVAHPGLTELIITKSMHERKYKMADLADAFAVLPGGLGTLDEMAEILTWNQLLLIRKPIGLLNVNKYYNSLLAMMDQMVDNGFLRAAGRNLLSDHESPEELIRSLKRYKPGKESVWDSIKRG
ncbi:MAG: TIGR00730 family Rossman fold protein [Cyclobacteriaceae bacterium]